MQQHSLLAVKIPFGFGHRRQNWGRGTQGTCTPDYGEWTSHALVPRKLYAAWHCTEVPGGEEIWRYRMQENPLADGVGGFYSASAPQTSSWWGWAGCPLSPSPETYPPLSALRASRLLSSHSQISSGAARFGSCCLCLPKCPRLVQEFFNGIFTTAGERQ